MSFTSYGNKQVNIRLESEILQKIESKARENNLSPSDWIRNAIRSALGEEIPGAISRLEFEKAIAGLDERLARLELAGAKQLLAGEVIKPEPKKKAPAIYTPTPKPGEEDGPEPAKKTRAKPKGDGEKKPKPRYEPISLDGGLSHNEMWKLCGGSIGSVRTAGSIGQIKQIDGVPYQYFVDKGQWLQVDLSKEIGVSLSGHINYSFDLAR